MTALLRGYRGLAAAVLALALLVAVGARSARADGSMTFVDNGKIRVGVSLNDGSISYLSLVRGEHAHNLVQQVQQSYYGGPPEATWHALAAGGTVLASKNDSRTIYTKVLARQEPEYRECQCTLETWVTLAGTAVHVRNRLTNYRSEKEIYPAQYQELPALYTTGDAYRLYTYDGDAPYTGGPLREITEDAGGFFSPGPNFLATEHWAALVNDAGFGVGLFNPRLARFSGIPGTEEAREWGWVNGYMTTSTPEILDPNITYSYSYTLIVGSLDDIRSYAVDHSASAPPAYRFRADRQHWSEVHASDTGFPLRGALRVRLDRDDPQLLGPEQVWSADDAPTIYVRGAWHTRPGVARLYWRTSEGGFSDERALPFAPTPDGRFHTYRLRLADFPGYEGLIDQLRLDLAEQGQPGAYVDITCISATPCRTNRRDERRLARTRPMPSYVDTFSDSAINAAFWSIDPGAAGSSTASANGRLEITMAPDAHPQPGQSYMPAGVTTRCRIAGDYDVQVDYALLEWPPANGVHVNFDADYTRAIGRLNSPSDVYFAWFPPNGNWLPTSDVAGALRLVRSGDGITGYYRENGQWSRLYSASVTRDNALIHLSLSTNASEFAGQEVKVAFDDFRVNRGRIACS